jgi:hypothetical protein
MPLVEIKGNQQRVPCEHTEFCLLHNGVVVHEVTAPIAAAEKGAANRPLVPPTPAPRLFPKLLLAPILTPPRGPQILPGF